MTRVIDASVAVKWLVDETDSAIALDVLGALATEAGEPLLDDEGGPRPLEGGTDLVAPDLILIEVANVLRRKCNDGEIGEPQAVEAIRSLPRLFDRLVGASETCEQALTMGIRLNHPALDCAYLACAEATDGVLITADEKFVAKCVKGGYQARVRSLASLGA